MENIFVSRNIDLMIDLTWKNKITRHDIDEAMHVMNKYLKTGMQNELNDYSSCSIQFDCVV